MKVFWIVLLSIAFIVSFFLPPGVSWAIAAVVPLIAIVRLIMSKHAKVFWIVQLCIAWAIGVILFFGVIMYFVDEPEAVEWSYYILDGVSITAIVNLIIEAVRWRDSDDSDTQTRSYSAMWECPGCGRKNARYAERCSTCGRQRPEYITAQVNRENERRDSDSPLDSSYIARIREVSSGTWNCPTCGLKNKMSYPRCLHCNTNNPYHTPENPPEQPQTYDRSSVDLSKNEPGSYGASGAADIVFCRKCGTKMPGDSLFCPKCGLKIS